MNDQKIIIKNRGALKIACIYLLMGGLWILLSDKFVGAVALDRNALIIFSMVKGWGYVIVTALLLYWLIQRSTTALNTNKARFASIINSAMDAIISIDNMHHIVLFNPAAEKMFGYTKDEVIGQSLDILIPELYRAEHHRQIDEFGRTGITNRHMNGYREITGLKKNGDEFFIDTSISQINANGQKLFTAILRDVTQHKRAEEALRTSEYNYRSILEQASDGIFIADASGRYIEVNPSGCAMLGYTREELLAKKISDLVPPEDLASTPIRMDELKQGKIILSERRLIRKDGTLLPVEISARMLSDGRLQGIQRDITERKEAEQKNAQLAAIVEYSDDVILSKTLDGIITSWNKGAEKIYGYSVEEAIGKPISLLVPPQLEDEIPQILEKVRQGEHIEHYETLRRKKDGQDIFVSLTISPIRDAGGKIIAASTIGRDITERKKAEETLRKMHDELELQFQQRSRALSEANALLETMLEYVPDQIYFKDAESRFIKNSRAQARALGLSDPSLVVGKTDFDFFPHAKKSYDEEREIIRSGKSLVDFEERVVWPDGKETWVSTTKVPLRDQEGKIIGTFGISRDITNRKRIEETLRKAKDELEVIVTERTAELSEANKNLQLELGERQRIEEAVRQLNETLEGRIIERTAQLESANKELEAFSYSVSHDLRSPLRGIDGWSLALLEDYGSLLDEKGRGHLQRVRTETQRMGTLIDDILQLSRITRSEMNKEKVDLSALAEAVAARLQETKPEGRRVKFNIQKGLTTNGDPKLLDVVLTNLLDNAFKFTGKKQIADIGFGQTLIEDAPVFFVRDNGAGFDMASANKLFGAFQRMHRASEFPGTGVGLATAQRVIHRHGGKIWVESEVGEGTTFYFTLEDNQ